MMRHNEIQSKGSYQNYNRAFANIKKEFINALIPRDVHYTTNSALIIILSLTNGEIIINSIPKNIQFLFSLETLCQEINNYPKEKALQFLQNSRTLIPYQERIENALFLLALMIKEDFLYGLEQLSEEETVSSSISTSDMQQQCQLPPISISWKLHRDYKPNIIVDLIFKTNQIQPIGQQQRLEDEQEMNKLNKTVPMFVEEFNSFKCMLTDKTSKKIGNINLILRQESLDIKQQHISTINEFLNDLKNECILEEEVNLIVDADFNWNGINLEFISLNVLSLTLLDIYSYLPISHFQYPKLRKIVITPSTNRLSSHSIAQADTVLMQDVEKDFDYFLQHVVQTQISSLKIDGNKFPSLIKALLTHFLHLLSPNLKKLEITLNLDPRQFHVILSISHLKQIYGKCKICLNFSLDFALLFLKTRHSTDTIFISNINDDEKFSSLTQFPYLFSEILNNFENKNIKLTYKNLKTIQQIELFDNMRAQSIEVLKNDPNIYQKFLQMSKNSVASSDEVFASLTSLIYAKYNQLPPFFNSNNNVTLNNNKPFSSNNLNQLQNNLQQQSQDSTNHQIKMNLNKPIFSYFFNSLIYKTPSEELPNAVNAMENLCEERKKQMEQNNSENLSFFKSSTPNDEIKQNTMNCQQQNTNKTNTFPFQSFQKFKSHQETSGIVPFQQKKLSQQHQTLTTHQEESQLGKQELQTKTSDNVFSTFFLPFQTTEVTSIELVFENTIFGSNYKQLFTFISKCTHLRKLHLINFCYSEEQQKDNDAQVNNQRQKSDTQQALHVYSQVFQARPRQTIQQIIPDFIQSLRKTNLVYCKLSTNVEFNYPSAQRILQTQENMIYFSLRDFSSQIKHSQPTNSFPVSQNTRSNNRSNNRSNSLQKQLSDAVSEIIDQNKNILSFNFKNSDSNCIQSKKEFCSILSFYLHLKKTLLCQIYASKYLLHSDIIKRKEIFNYLITKFYIQPINISSHINNTMANADSYLS